MSFKRSREKREEKVTAPRWEDYKDEDHCNPDRLLLCPYDPNHLIRACRFPYHLIKCRKNHPELAGELWTCPFNARHLMRKHELSDHISTCVDRCSIKEDCVESVKTESRFQIPVSTWTAPVCEEDWDKEDENAAVAPSLVWSVSTTQLTQDREGNGTFSNLTPGLRAPKVLPWNRANNCIDF